MSHPSKTRQAGFTIIEMLIAMVIFSLIVIVITVAVLQFSKQYYKGVISNSTQGVARTIIDDLTRSIEFNSGGVPGIGTQQGYCVGDTKRYSFELYRQVTDSSPNAGQHQSRHGLVVDTVSGCNSGTPPLPVATMTNFSGLTNARELLGQHMRLAELSIKSINPTSDAYTITVKVVYGDDDLLMSPSDPTNPAAIDNPDIICKSTAGSQFCAVSKLSTTVQKRLGN